MLINGQIGVAVEAEVAVFNFLICDISTGLNFFKALVGMDSHTLRINVEPGLFEWMHWCRNGVPSWMTPEELSHLGYPINHYYIPLLKPDELCINETLTDFYERSFALVRKILSIHSEGTIFTKGHIISFKHFPRFDFWNTFIANNITSTILNIISNLGYT